MRRSMDIGIIGNYGNKQGEYGISQVSTAKCAPSSQSLFKEFLYQYKTKKSIQFSHSHSHIYSGSKHISKYTEHLQTPTRNTVNSWDNLNRNNKGNRNNETELKSNKEVTHKFNLILGRLFEELRKIVDVLKNLMNTKRK